MRNVRCINKTIPKILSFMVLKIEIKLKNDILNKNLSIVLSMPIYT